MYDDLKETLFYRKQADTRYEDMLARIAPHIKTALPLLEDAHRNGRAGLWEAIELFRELTDDIS